MLTNTPSLLGVMAVYAIVVTPLSVGANVVGPVLTIVLFLAMLVLLAFLGPFLLGGGIGLASDGLRGGGGLDAFVEAGKENYLYMLGFTWVLGAIEVAWSVVVGIVFYIVSIFLIVAAVLGVVGAGTSTAAQVVLGVVGVVVGIGFLLLYYLVAGLPMILAQFVPGAYVIEGREPIDGVKRGLGLFKDNVLSALGFDVTTFVAGMVINLIPIGVIALAAYVLGPHAVMSFPTFPDPGTAAGSAHAAPGMSQGAGGTFRLTLLGAALYGLPLLVVAPIQLAFVTAFYTALYHEIAGVGDEGIDGDDVKPDATEWEPADDAAA